MLELKRIPTAMASVALAIVAGCAATPPLQSSGQLLNRLDSAERITNAGDRDPLLSDVAVESARSGQPAICLRAFNGIHQTAVRDRTAEACAAAFNRRGDRPSADTMVGQISSTAAQDRIRENYAAHPAPVVDGAYGP